MNDEIILISLFISADVGIIYNKTLFILVVSSSIQTLAWLTSRIGNISEIFKINLLSEPRYMYIGCVSTAFITESLYIHVVIYCSTQVNNILFFKDKKFQCDVPCCFRGGLFCRIWESITNHRRNRQSDRDHKCGDAAT